MKLFVRLGLIAISLAPAFTSCSSTEEALQLFLTAIRMTSFVRSCDITINGGATQNRVSGIYR